jgi:hypothetical protein
MTLLAKIRWAGIGITLDGTDLMVDADQLSDRQIAFLRRHKAELVAELRTPMRPIVEYHFPDDPPKVWHVMLGMPGETLESAFAVCRRQFGDVETRERDSLPAGFPFKRDGDDGEWKAPDGTEGP